MSILFPATCILCHAASKRKLDLCTACENDLLCLKNYCSLCALPLPQGQTVCGTCLHNPLLFSIRTFALFYYQEPIKHLIRGLKFNNQLVNAKILGELLANYLSEQYQNQDKPEVIIPIPLHPTRLRERGYNQALELARPIANRLKIPIDKSMVERIKHTLAQARLPTKERTQNIKRAFHVNQAKKRHYKYVAVIDDVITTGSTATELCNILYQDNIEKIDLWCLAKAHF